jgi:hypothetical protein
MNSASPDAAIAPATLELSKGHEKSKETRQRLPNGKVPDQHTPSGLLYKADLLKNNSATLNQLGVPLHVVVQALKFE